MKNYYDILGIAKTATSDEIKKAYRSAALKHHPDKNPDDAGAVERFKEIQEAYDTLSDSDKRAQYDNPISDPWGGFNFVRGNKSKSMPTRGRDLSMQFVIKLRDILHDKPINISFPRDNVCKKCNGEGAKPNTSRIKCAKCNGTGRVRDVQHYGNSYICNEMPCGCDDGHIIAKEDRCEGCDGKGRVLATASIDVTVPAGIMDGMILRVPQEGYLGRNGGERGYLYAKIHISPDPKFTRHASNPMILTRYLDISFVQACLGEAINVEMIDGSMKSVQIPAGCQSGHVIALPSEGLPSMDNNSYRGDLHIQIRIVVPTALNNEQKALLERFFHIEKEKVNNVP